MERYRVEFLRRGAALLDCSLDRFILYEFKDHVG